MMFSFMGVPPGSSNVSLSSDMHTGKHISVDGDCLFRSLAFIITGSENQHMAIHTAILEHVIDIVCHRYIQVD